MLAPHTDIFELKEWCDGVWDNMEWSVQTNLTYKLTESHKRIFQEVCSNSFGTSWDAGIRWTTDSQKRLWDRNVKELVDEGAEITVMVSIDKTVASMRPITILKEFKALGIRNVMFEKITHDGNAKDLNAPSNEEVNTFFLWMLEDAREHKYYEWIHNATLVDILESFKQGDGLSTHCRDCEQKILTISASGAVSGCPNTAQSYTYGYIGEALEDLLKSPVREKRVLHEIDIDSRCYSCDFFAICKGGCHQLEWEGATCPSPKQLFREVEKLQGTQLFDDIVRGP